MRVRLGVIGGLQVLLASTTIFFMPAGQVSAEAPSSLTAWQKECRITIQQIAYNKGLVETVDDWSCATFWYEPIPSGPLPQLLDVKARTADIWPE